jgi:hypothetical protein
MRSWAGLVADACVDAFRKVGLWPRHPNKFASVGKGGDHTDASTEGVELG